MVISQDGRRGRTIRSLDDAVDLCVPPWSPLLGEEASSPSLHIEGLSKSSGELTAVIRWTKHTVIGSRIRQRGGHDDEWTQRAAEMEGRSKAPSLLTAF